jgi:hypothetical protein
MKTLKAKGVKLMFQIFGFILEIKFKHILPNDNVEGVRHIGRRKRLIYV